MASSIFEGCAIDLSFSETEFKSAGMHEMFKTLIGDL